MIPINRTSMKDNNNTDIFLDNQLIQRNCFCPKTMTGRGKGGKGLGKGGAKRHRKVLRDNIQVS